MVLLYTNNKEDKKEIKEKSPFTIATNNIKCPGVTLTKQVKDSCDKEKKNFKSLKKENE